MEEFEEDGSKWSCDQGAKHVDPDVSSLRLACIGVGFPYLTDSDESLSKSPGRIEATSTPKMRVKLKNLPV